MDNVGAVEMTFFISNSANAFADDDEQLTTGSTAEFSSVPKARDDRSSLGIIKPAVYINCNKDNHQRIFCMLLQLHFFTSLMTNTYFYHTSGPCFSCATFVLSFLLKYYITKLRKLQVAKPDIQHKLPTVQLLCIQRRLERTKSYKASLLIHQTILPNSFDIFCRSDDEVHSSGS